MPIYSFFARGVRRLLRRDSALGPATEQVALAYEIVLGRKPDAVGLKSFSDNISTGRQTMLEVVIDLYNSKERQGKPAVAVSKIYKMVLRREPDELGLESHSTRLRNGEIELSELLGEFLSSDEFVLRFTRLPAVARKLVDTLMGGLLQAHPGTAAVNHYANAMEHGLTLSDFVNELKASPEFGGLGGRTNDLSRGASVDLAVLAQELIAAQMTSEGSIMGLPPISVIGAAPVSTQQLASLIRTLGMLSSAERH
jgi:hypothetical protein